MKIRSGFILGGKETLTLFVFSIHARTRHFCFRSVLFQKSKGTECPEHPAGFSRRIHKEMCRNDGIGTSQLPVHR